ncbi:MAG: hypothetical protein DI533_04610 [Cereibacter sphaeroides]|uniref:Uncharacterized protein n=1 Tax=Cereibacter sphaeroides TaxID=1063 RepID=A0A2W5SA80_CERSP|nr:MAG: hypothetical protein DI533_04610 [Cereibacter sphaeroides]
MIARQTYSLDEIKAMLHAQIETVAHHYARPASGSYTDKGLYFTLNPGRADRSVGSFCIHLSGPKIGRWNDYATGDFGDVLDLIGLSLGLNASDQVREARAFLGLEVETPEIRVARAKAIERAKLQRQASEREQAAEAERRAKQAEGLYLSAEPDLFGTPVQYYLAARRIALGELAHPPGALRYHAAVGYHREETDPETGEVITTRMRLPAMVASIVNGKGRIVACHRTYLAIGASGIWGKANLPDVKKVLGDYRGGSIRLSSGIGSRGGKAVPLAQCPPGSRVVIGEGIETCLSAMLCWPAERVLAAVSLANMAAVELPRNVAEVVLLSDNDTHPQALAQFQAAVDAHAKAGRTVRVWRSDREGEDLNDALKRLRAERQEGAA